MSRAPLLFNALALDAVPTAALRIRRVEQARQLVQARYIIRRKQDGRFLGALIKRAAGYALLPLDPALVQPELQLPQLLAMLGVHTTRAVHARRVVLLRDLPDRQVSLPGAANPLRFLLRDLGEFGIDPLRYAEVTGLPLQLEPPTLAWAGSDVYGRALWLTAETRQAWQAMCSQAASDGVRLHAISGFRGYAYQSGILRRKLRRGLALLDILQVNAAPGFSEHHTGRAIDIGCPGEPAAEESFERSAAFAWLLHRAAAFGFRLSYPRDNPHGIVYEPWHWCWHPPGTSTRAPP